MFLANLPFASRRKLGTLVVYIWTESFYVQKAVCYSGMVAFSVS